MKYASFVLCFCMVYAKPFGVDLFIAKIKDTWGVSNFVEFLLLGIPYETFCSVIFYEIEIVNT